MKEMSINEIAGIWAFRWHECCRPGCYVVTIMAGSFFSENLSAVIDDFGNLVRVQ